MTPDPSFEALNKLEDLVSSVEPRWIQPFSNFQTFENLQRAMGTTMPGPHGNIYPISLLPIYDELYLQNKKDQLDIYRKGLLKVYSDTNVNWTERAWQTLLLLDPPIPISKMMIWETSATISRTYGYLTTHIPLLTYSVMASASIFYCKTS